MRRRVNDVVPEAVVISDVVERGGGETEAVKQTRACPMLQPMPGAANRDAGVSRPLVAEFLSGPEPSAVPGQWPCCDAVRSRGFDQEFKGGE